MARRRLLDRHHENRDHARSSTGRLPAPPVRPRPRRPAGSGGPSGFDQHTLMVRRRLAAGVAVVLVIVIVLVINGCLKSQKQQSLKDYNHNVGEIAAGIRHAGRKAAVHRAGRRRRQVRPGSAAADQQPARRSAETGRAGEGPERARRNDRRSARPAARARPAGRRDHQDRCAGAERTGWTEQTG